ncbi:hypothetical protein [Brachyspira murdochii]|uniref:Uncharacterized protein n=1 Tax=Brachyspira murdochii TaxID=84378 RepID=A0ABX5B3U7_9SPIR|nr:hypothetical protein [Brachyspira murdochii]PPS21318.1 hypothetical protein DJ52_11605 [Brachyspira murdochii]
MTITAEDQIVIDDFKYDLDKCANLMYEHTLQCRQSILKECHANKSNYSGSIRIFKKQLQSFIEDQYLNFEIPDGLLTNINEYQKNILEKKVVKIFETFIENDRRISYNPPLDEEDIA